MADGRIYACSTLCDLIHAETARVLGEYGRDFYAGMPTRYLRVSARAMPITLPPAPAWNSSPISIAAASRRPASRR